MANLLTNPGFEADWGDEKSHDCLVVPVVGGPQEKEVGNIFTPPGWTTWFRHDPGTCDQPEVRDAWAEQDPRRVRNGKKGILLFTFYRRHDAGFLQQVQVTPGQRLRLTAWGHAWSNHLSKDAGGHPDDGRWSDGAGYSKVAWEAGTMPITGDPQEDAKSNFTFQVGIDPTGGTDPTADTVVWGRGYHIYNGYCQELAVEATAQAAVVTVFLRSQTAWPFKHNDSYWDDVMLVEETSPVPPSYQSTMLVLPQDANLEQLSEVMRAAYPNRRTFGFSHDDAVALNGRAVLYNIPKNKHQGYVDWYAARNPNVELKWAFTSDWVEPSVWGAYLVLQRDYPGETFGAGGACSIPALGCYLSCIAMAKRIYGIDPDATPVSVNAELGEEGFTGCLPFWSAIEKCQIHIEGEGDLVAHLEDGLVAMLEVDFDPDPDIDQHFVLAVELDGEDDLVILDPWHGICKLSDHYGGFRSVRFLYPTTSEVYGDPDVGGKEVGISLHLQTMVPGCLDFIEATQPRLVKVLASYEDVYRVLERSPETVVVVRNPVTNDYGDTLEDPDPERGARKWVNKFRDAIIRVGNEAHERWPGCEIVVESVNECVPSLNEEMLLRLVNFDIAFIREVEALGMPWIRAGVLNAAVGNPHESEFHLLLPLAKACAIGGHYMDYHSYWRGFPGDSRLASEYIWYSGRWAEMDKVFTKAGIYIKWYGGESGVYATAHDGWRSSICYKGDWTPYFTDIKTMIQTERDWNARNGNRKYENTLFTSGIGTGWDSFQIREPQMEAVAGYLLG